MAQKKVVETVYGKYSKYEIVRKSKHFSTRFNVYKDGSYETSFKSLKAAVKWAEKK
jgi:hypothetical protein